MTARTGAIRRASVLAALVLFLSAIGPALGDDWPQYRGINRDGTSAEKGWLKSWPPTEMWRATIGIGFSSVAVSQGRVYATGSLSHKDYTYCFDAVTGAKLWSYSFPVAANPTDGPRATPTVDGDRVYTYSHMGDLYCFNKVTGEVVWNKLVNGGRMNEWGFSGSPLIVDNMIILNGGGNQGIALDKNTPSKVIWSSGGTAGFSSPKLWTTKSRRIVMLVGTNNPKGSAVGVDAATGEYLWSYGGAGGTIQNQDPQFYGSDMFFTKCALYQIGNEGKTLTKIWANDNMGWSYSLPVVVGDYAYGVTRNSTLRCVALSDGSVKWSREHMREGSLIASDGKLIWFGSDEALIICKADPKSFDTEGREPYKGVMRLPSRHDEMACPVLANGLLYVRTYGGELVCLNMGAGKETQTQAAQIPAAQKARLVIKAAIYGGLPDGPKIDVTDAIARMVNADTLSVQATNDNFTDPAGGVAKKLKVDYTFDGKAKSKTVNENETLTISNTGD